MTAISELKQNQVIFPKLGIDITINDTAFTLFGLCLLYTSPSPRD